MDKGDMRPGHLPWKSLVYLRVLEDKEFGVMRLPSSEPTPVGYVFLFANKRFELLGGDAGINDQSPRETAMRRVTEQLFLQIPIERFAFRDRWVGGEGGIRWKCLFVADIYETERNKIDFGKLHKQGSFVRHVGTQEYPWILHEDTMLNRHRTLLELVHLLSAEKQAA